MLSVLCSALTHIGPVEDGRNDPQEEDEADEQVALRPPRRDERARLVADELPVERQEAHAQSGACAEEGVDGKGAWPNPAKEAERGQGREDPAGEEPPKEGGDAEENKVLEAAHRSILSIVFGVEGIEDCAEDENLRPDHRRRADEEIAGEPGQGHCKELRGDSQEEGKADWLRRAIVVGRVQGDDGVEGVHLNEANVGHDDDGCVLCSFFAFRLISPLDRLHLRRPRRLPSVHLVLSVVFESE